LQRTLVHHYQEDMAFVNEKLREGVQILREKCREFRICHDTLKQERREVWRRQ
jgi:hypothetical protein